MTKEKLLAFYYEVRKQFELKGKTFTYSNIYLNSIIHARKIDYREIEKQLNQELKSLGGM